LCPICPLAGSVLARVFSGLRRAAVKTGSDLLDHCGSAPSEEITDRKECRQGPRRTASCRRGTADKKPGRQAGSVPAGGNQRELHCPEPSRVAGRASLLSCRVWEVWPIGSLGAPARYIAGTCQVYVPLTCGFPAISMGVTRAAESGACAATRGPGNGDAVPPRQRGDTAVSGPAAGAVGGIRCRQHP
jgi:hypothetical protein